MHNHSWFPEYNTTRVLPLCNQLWNGCVLQISRQRYFYVYYRTRWHFVILMWRPFLITMIGNKCVNGEFCESTADCYPDGFSIRMWGACISRQAVSLTISTLVTVLKWLGVTGETSGFPPPFPPDHGKTCDSVTSNTNSQADTWSPPLDHSISWFV